jgi:hypothetical protein
MKTQSNTTRYRYQLDKVPYSTFPNHLLLTDKLSAEAKILLMAIINSAETWNISLEYYKKIFGWSKRKITSTSKELQVNGYLKQHKYPKGKGIAGAKYYYTVSEFGNLNKQDETQVPNVNEQIENTQVQPETKDVTAVKETTQVDDIPTDEQLQILLDVTNKIKNDIIKNQIQLEFAGFINDGKLTTKNFNFDKIKKYITKRETELKIDTEALYIKEALNNLEVLIAEGIDGKNKEIRDGIKFQLKQWVNDQIELGMIPTYSQIKAKKLQFTSKKKGSAPVDAESPQN